MDILEIKNLTKTYPGGITAVKDLSLSVKGGDIFGFIGHNGAGKTTTIRSVVGALDFDAGSIQIMGCDIKQNPEAAKSRLAFIPDNPDLYDYLTGIQYINYMADIFRVTKAKRNERVRKYSALLGLEKRLGDLIGAYSHGMRQKCAIIGALVHNPSLLVLDEPFVGLDPEATINVKSIMREICRNGGAIFFSTHILEVAEKLCGKIAIIKNGELAACGETSAITGDKSLEQIFIDIKQDANNGELS